MELLELPEAESLGRREYMALRKKAEIACENINLLESQGYIFEASEEDLDLTEEIITQYMGDPETATRTLEGLPAATVLSIKGILDSYGYAIATRAKDIRNVVINKLLLETENPDARHRIRALELLGKTSDVALFTERSEVKITHQNTAAIEEALREKLSRVLDMGAIDAEFVEVPRETGRDKATSAKSK